MHTGRATPRRATDAFDGKSGFLCSAEANVPAVSSFNNSNNDFFTAVTEQHMMKDELPNQSGHLMQPEMPQTSYSTDSAMPSASLITPLSFNPDMYLYSANVSANVRPPIASRSNVTKLSGWTDPSIPYTASSQSVQHTDRPSGSAGPNVWTNSYPSS